MEGPYSIQLKSKSMFYTVHQIVFEGTPVRNVINVSRDLLENMVELMNIAYSLGFSSGKIVGKMEAHQDEQTSREN